MVVAHAAPATPKSKAKMKIGSRIVFRTVPKAAIIMGSFMSPSPERMDRKNAEKIRNEIP